uniref:hypothetical protein n=1 Tax=Paenirhodobacter enshiensis TaxID=1105367 RepID=UPI0035ADF87F
MRRRTGCASPRGADLKGWKREPDCGDKELDRTIEVIVQGFPLPKLKHKSAKLEARKAELMEKLANAPEPPALRHPRLSDLYREKIANLSATLTSRG